jgi:hypothetical protein
MSRPLTPQQAAGALPRLAAGRDRNGVGGWLHPCGCAGNQEWDAQSQAGLNDFSVDAYFGKPGSKNSGTKHESMKPQVAIFVYMMIFQFTQSRHWAKLFE